MSPRFSRLSSPDQRPSACISGSTSVLRSPRLCTRISEPPGSAPPATTKARLTGTVRPTLAVRSRVREFQIRPPPSAPNRCQSVSIGGPIVRPQSPRSGSAFISGSTSVLCVSAWEPPVAGFGATGYSRAVPLKQHETETTDFTDEHGSSSDHPWQSVKSVVTLQPARSAMLLPRKAVPPRASTLSSRLSASFRPGSAFHLLDFRQPVPWHPTTSRSAPRRGLPRPPFLRSLRYLLSSPFLLPSSVLRLPPTGNRPLFTDSPFP